MPLIIEVKDLVMQYPGGAEPAVQDLSFGVLQGEVLSLLGPNGAGKTTILSILGGRLRPSRGEVLIAGHSLQSDPRAFMRAVGFVPQGAPLHPRLRVREHLQDCGRRYGLGGPELRQRIEEALETAGLLSFADEPVGEYSRARQVRLAMAASLLHRPQVLLIDEPTLGLDAPSRYSIWTLLKSVKAQGTTVLHATRDVEEAQGLGDRIGLMDQGRLRALGTREELVSLVGQYDEVELHLASEAAPAQLLKVLAAEEGVRQVHTRGHSVRLLAQNGKTALLSLVAVANSLGARVTDVSVRKPGLEAVFSQLTGRTLGDGTGGDFCP